MKNSCKRTVISVEAYLGFYIHLGDRTFSGSSEVQVSGLGYIS